ncbi:cobalt transporter ATP-binding subunit [Mycoplasmopsis gallinacea]|uniref:Energy-coupling factor transporter ATP-binding protein EcfA2 n=1 Tax=Mycoplasmopsis gallinacea TaxID=29556 RepID=A0A0D5ZJV8_9BACT|nr:cobalt transporter ATP-binding subunit [Mycoplasmopsis gallinacea]
MQIKIKNLSHIFSRKTPWEFQALNNVNFEVKQGEYVGVIGQTGSGKTTFIEHLNGLLLPTKGEITWIYDTEIYNKKIKQNEVNTLEVYCSNPKMKNSVRFRYNQYDENKKLIRENKRFRKIKTLRKNVGIVFQFAEYQLFKATIEEDIIFGPVSLGVPIEEAKKRAEKYIQLVGLPTSYLKRSPFDLSGGQKRRVALAGILAMEPNCLVVDEPTAGLDPVGVKEILDIIADLNENHNVTIINVTHDLDNILARSKRVIIFKDGQIVRDGKPYEILNDVEFLKENNLQPPKLLEFVNKLRNKGINVPKVTTEEELIAFLNDYLKSKGVN